MKDALEKLYRRHTFGIKPGLDVEKNLLARLGNPERAFGCIHVAGTNGKGSVCAFLESILRHAGYSTGLYTSPHLVRFNERLCVDGAPIGDPDLAPVIDKAEKAAAEVAAELRVEPTFFETSTAMAFDYFRKRGVDLAVVEVGMGGRLDATNVIVPLVSVITRVSLEHTAYLGPDIPTIAGEKAGIIKKGRPVVCARMDEAALAVIRRTAAERGSPLSEAGSCVTVAIQSRDLSGQKVTVETADASYGTLQLPLLGEHQVENLATAIAAVDVLRSACGLKIEDAAVKKGVARASWPARFQVLGRTPPIILDGAHNPGAAEALARTIKDYLPKKPIGLVTGMCGDKDAHGFFKALRPLVRKAWIVPLRSERNMPPDGLVTAGQSMGWQVQGATLADALIEAWEWAASVDGAVCIAGSLFLAGEVLELLEKGGLPALAARK